jgi:lipopolysaccharide/colanic/teichoic acid biosynthesis glycosyltransferase
VPTPRPPPDNAGVPEVGDRPSSAVSAPPRPPELAGRSWSKRLFDIGVGLVAGLVVLPMLIAIAVVLKIGNGQVIYRAPRIGRDGKPFTMFKFATMVPGDSGPRVSRQRDPRITPLGGWLRATKLNELPQILNVIKGDMSLVGPRPEDPRYTAHFSARQRDVLAVRPGMTSLAFLEFGDEQEFIERARPEDVEAFYLRTLLPEKLDIELSYVHNWSMREDLRILARTVRALLR